MSLTSTIFNTITDPSNDPVVGAVVIARLKPINSAVRVDDATEISGEVRAVTDVNGYYELELERNGNITPANTYWEIEERVPRSKGGTNVWAIVVGAADASVPMSAIQTVPDFFPGTALSVEAGDLRYIGSGDIGDNVVTRTGIPQTITSDKEFTGLVQFTGPDNRGTFADRPAPGNEGAFYIAQWCDGAIARIFHDNGIKWQCIVDPPNTLNPLDFGADPTNTEDSRQAFLDLLDAAATPVYYELGEHGHFSKILITGGQYRIEGGDINLPDGITDIEGIGGGLVDFTWNWTPIIGFVTGGFVTSPSVSHAVSIDRVSIFSGTTPFTALTICGKLSNLELRSTSGTNPALHLDNDFWGDFDNVVFRSNAGPSIVITTDNTPTLLGWLFRWNKCRFYTGGVRWDIGNSHATVVGAGTMFESCDVENFPADMPFFHIRNTHATETTSFHSLDIRNFSWNDSDSNNPLVRVETMGTGQLEVKLINLMASGGAGNGYDIDFVNTGGGLPYASVITTEYLYAPYINFASPSGISVWGYQNATRYFLADASGNAMLKTAVDGESQARMLIYADGRITRGLGSSAPTIINAVKSGTPEGNTTAGIGSTMQRSDGGAGTSLYVKESGTGNTGWVGK